MKDEQLMQIVGGGFVLTATFLNSLSRIINTVHNLGRSIGTSIRMIKSNTIC